MMMNSSCPDRGSASGRCDTVDRRSYRVCRCYPPFACGGRAGSAAHGTYSPRSGDRHGGIRRRHVRRIAPGAVDLDRSRRGRGLCRAFDRGSPRTRRPRQCDSSHAYVDSVTRAASLVPRRHDHYLAARWRILLFGVTIAGLASFVWRPTIPSSSDRRLFLPVFFALVAAVFLWLYEVWIDGIVTGPTVPDSNDVDHERRRSIRMVFASEFILVAGFLALAHGLLDLDWTARGAWGAIAAVGGGLLGVIGCSLAL